MSSVFETLNAIDVNDCVEKKSGLSYISWAHCWRYVKKNFPTAFYTIYENADGWNYHTDGKTCWVKTGVTIDGLEHIEYLPVMDFKNKSIKADDVTSFDVNKAIQRSLTKACARHGLGLYIYAGEDLPEEESKLLSQEELVKEGEARTRILKYISANENPQAVKDWIVSKFGVEPNKMNYEQAMVVITTLEKKGKEI